MILAILQARMSSSRLPGKVLMPLAGAPMIVRQIERVARSERIDKLVVATSDDPSDDALAKTVAHEAIGVHRGPLDDVLARFIGALTAFGPADHVVRLTGDCPLADPAVIDATIDRVLAAGADYGSNTPPRRTFPKGLDVEVMTVAALHAASLAAHLGLNNIIYLYDDNHISIEGSTDLAFTEDRGKRFEAYGWFVQHVTDGNDLQAIDKAIRAAHAEKERPSIIMVRTHIGYGSPNKHDTAEAHGSPLGEEEVKLTKENLGWPLEPKFHVPAAALAQFRKAIESGEQAEAAWQARLTAYRQAHPAENSV